MPRQDLLRWVQDAGLAADDLVSAKSFPSSGKTSPKGGRLLTPPGGLG